MFPTRSRDKISSLLAYPVNAKQISQALEDVPLAEELSLSFRAYGSAERLRAQETPLKVLDLSYSCSQVSRFTPRRADEGEPQWSILIYTVRSALKPRVKTLLEAEGFARCRKWLLERPNLTGRLEHQSLRIFYDEARDAIEYRTHRHL